VFTGGGIRAERWKLSHCPLPAARDARPPMTSSPMLAAARSQYLLDLLAQVPDPRSRRGIRHPLAGLLAMGIAAVIAGSRSFAAIGQWAADAGGDVLTVPGATRGRRTRRRFGGRSLWSARTRWTRRWERQGQHAHPAPARRTIKAVLAPAWTDFEAAAQVAQLRRTVTREGKKTTGT
jgi:DDE_Tnp_1-associated